MTTQNTQTTTPAPDRAEQGSHHWVITLDLPGRAAATQYGTLTPVPGATRYDTFLHIRQYVVEGYPELANATVVFFALEANQL
ncbi:hypothetical protein ACIPYQ_31280 [Streptomyces sp. NPDC090045]|uniref:hypothetical protein n=1 Tax=Streptomyces sp. NPDC090045 TaxID=3365927 RepID=UPI00380F0432